MLVETKQGQLLLVEMVQNEYLRDLLGEVRLTVSDSDGRFTATAYLSAEESRRLFAGGVLAAHEAKEARHAPAA